MTIVVNVDKLPLDQVIKQLNKLVEVIKIVELPGSSAIKRELLLVKVSCDTDTRAHVLDAVQLFKAKVIDVAPDAITIQATGNSDKLADLLTILRTIRYPRVGPVGHGRHRSRFRFLRNIQLAHQPT